MVRSADNDDVKALTMARYRRSHLHSLNQLVTAHLYENPGQVGLIGIYEFDGALIFNNGAPVQIRNEKIIFYIS